MQKGTCARVFCMLRYGQDILRYVLVTYPEEETVVQGQVGEIEWVARAPHSQLGDLHYKGGDHPGQRDAKYSDRLTEINIGHSPRAGGSD